MRLAALAKPPHGISPPPDTTWVLGARRVDRLAQLVTELKEAGHHAEYAQLDVTDLENVQAFVADVLVRHGRVDLLVNNAGVMPLSLVEDLRVDDWNQMIDVNLRGVLHGIAAVLPSMRERRSGHIINVASHRGQPRGPERGRVLRNEVRRARRYPRACARRRPTSASPSSAPGSPRPS